MATLSNTPDYLEQTGYANPSDGRNGPFQSALKCPDVGIFDWFSRPENSSDWEAANSFFEGDRGSRPSWVTWFPVQEKLIDGSDPDTPLLVDVAGGRGHDLLEFYKKFPKAGSLVLQDQQPVLDGAVSLDSAIRKEKINFFKESPVPGLLRSYSANAFQGSIRRWLTSSFRRTHLLLEVYSARLVR